MKIFSDKIKYGLSALFELAKKKFKGYIQIKEIAQAQNIPQNYLEQLLIMLKRADLVESMRGAQGGYKLKRPANQIKLIDLIEGLEGNLTIINYSKLSNTLKYFWNNIEKESGLNHDFKLIDEEQEYFIEVKASTSENKILPFSLSIVAFLNMPCSNSLVARWEALRIKVTIAATASGSTQPGRAFIFSRILPINNKILKYNPQKSKITKVNITPSMNIQLKLGGNGLSTIL